jgi:hypothetical protein
VQQQFREFYGRLSVSVVEWNHASSINIIQDRHVTLLHGIGKRVGDLATYDRAVSD